MMQQMANDPNTMRRMMDPANIRAMCKCRKQCSSSVERTDASDAWNGGLGGLGTRSQPREHSHGCPKCQPVVPRGALCLNCNSWRPRALLTSRPTSEAQSNRRECERRSDRLLSGL